MKSQLWLWSRTHHWWTSGRLIIGGDTYYTQGHRWIREMVYRDSGIDIGPHFWHIPTHNEVRQKLVDGDWTPKTPEEIRRILDYSCLKTNCPACGYELNE